MSRRTARLGSQIQRLLAQGISQLSDPRIATFTSVTRVEVSPDLDLATAYVSIMAEKESTAALTIAALDAARGRLRKLLASELSIRRVPEVRFRLDESVQGAFDTVEVIDRLRDEVESNDEPGPAAGEEESA